MSGRYDYCSSGLRSRRFRWTDIYGFSHGYTLTYSVLHSARRSPVRRLNYASYCAGRRQWRCRSDASNIRRAGSAWQVRSGWTRPPQ